LTVSAGPDGFAALVAVGAAAAGADDAALVAGLVGRAAGVFAAAAVAPAVPVEPIKLYDFENGSVMAGQSVGMVTREQPTAAIIAELVEQAIGALASRGAAEARPVAGAAA